MDKIPESAADRDALTLSALFLGRIQGATRLLPEPCLRVLAARIIRESLIAALRQEGHSFTDQRFHEWFAGLKTLTDDPGHNLRPARAICQAILTEFSHSSWPHLAEAAQNLTRAFMAPADFIRSGHEAVHEDLNTVIAEARRLLASIDPLEDELPFQAVSALFKAARTNVRFGLQEAGLQMIHGPGRSLAHEVRVPENSRWALDILAGEFLSSPQGLPLAFPLPSLVRLSAPCDFPYEDVPDPLTPSPRDDAPAALRDALWQLDRMLGEAGEQVDLIRERSGGRRSSGRSTPVLEFLAGFGTLRSAQIEQLVGASRLGVRTILTAIAEMGLLASEASHNRTLMYRYAPSAQTVSGQGEGAGEFAFSRDALDEYEASMNAIDELLGRTSGSADKP
ncbi:hypothetical protein EDF56_11074 [Novosphingobium sp. PhB165]|uniref:hypothetical protein n=1 Tax=Novosphingobium sp. PhB165 TaxID=2485105 RepID=UPI00104E2A98|nr:hypothetical protein [Novosphingobium sp. PhB165]TCM15394.1 hypothetical protein EDF56_11074 [Novosphingobium sp. PhB165]